MAWERRKVCEQRLELIKAYIHGLDSMSNLCKFHKVSRKTAYKWVNRFLELGEDGLQDRSTVPNKIHYQYDEAQIQKAIDLKLKYRKWGPKKILAKLTEHYPNKSWPCPTTLYHRFKELHLVTSKRIRKRVPATAPLGDLTDCNDTWSMDLKGNFLTGEGLKCEPLTVVDNYSRYLIRCTHMSRHSVPYIWSELSEAFFEYGLPKRIRSDNGPPFGSTGTGRLTRLSINLIKAGVTPEWIRPGHPEENGRQERFHQTLKIEAATPAKKNLVLQIEALREFEKTYNFERPHESLDMKTPGQVYTRSSRVWDGILRPPEYDRSACQVRKVGQSGCIWYKGKEYYITQALTEEYIALTDGENALKAYYGPIYLGELSADNGFTKPKLITRRR
jgi:transposase InsO family protein